MCAKMFVSQCRLLLQDECLVINLMLNEDETTIFLLYTRQCQNESERTHTEKKRTLSETIPARSPKIIYKPKQEQKKYGGMEAKKREKKVSK